MLANVKDHYMKVLVSELETYGYSWVVINSRGITHKMTTGRPATSLEHSSVIEPMEHILKHKRPDQSAFVMGMSLGGNNLANVLAMNLFNT